MGQLFFSLDLYHRAEMIEHQSRNAPSVMGLILIQFSTGLCCFGNTALSCTLLGFQLPKKNCSGLEAAGQITEINTLMSDCSYSTFIAMAIV